MNQLFEKLYKGEIDLIETYGLPQNEIFRKVYNDWTNELIDNENSFLKNADNDKKDAYLDLIQVRAALELLEINAMFIEGIKIGLDLRCRKRKIKAIKKVF